MRLIHTSDWHLGHELHGFDRGVEHAAFLEWLGRRLVERRRRAVRGGDEPGAARGRPGADRRPALTARVCARKVGACSRRPARSSLPTDKRSAGDPKPLRRRGLGAPRARRRAPSGRSRRAESGEHLGPPPAGRRRRGRARDARPEAKPAGHAGERASPASGDERATADRGRPSTGWGGRRPRGADGGGREVQPQRRTG